MPARTAGGAEGNRTPDLCSAIAALSHLSYSPAPPAGLVGPMGSGRGKSGSTSRLFSPLQRLSRESFAPPIPAVPDRRAEERAAADVRFASGFDGRFFAGLSAEAKEETWLTTATIATSVRDGTTTVRSRSEERRVGKERR